MVVELPCQVVDIDSFPVDWDMVLGQVDHIQVQVDSLAAYFLVEHSFVVAVVDSCLVGVVAFVVVAAKNV